MNKYSYKGQIITASSKQEAISKIVASVKSDFSKIKKFLVKEEKKEAPFSFNTFEKPNAYMISIYGKKDYDIYYNDNTNYFKRGWYVERTDISRKKEKYFDNAVDVINFIKREYKIA